MTATAPSPTAAPAVPGSDIKLGLTLYSLTSEWAAGRYDLAGLLDAVDERRHRPGHRDRRLADAAAPTRS